MSYGTAACHGGQCRPETSQLDRMALVEPSLPEGAITGDWRSLPKEEAYLTLRAPGAATIKVSPFDDTSHTRQELSTTFSLAGLPYMSGVRSPGI